MPVVPLTARAIWCHDGLMQERYDARPGLTRTAALLTRLAEDCFAEWRLRAQEPQAEREAAALWELHLQPCYDDADSVCGSTSGDACLERSRDSVFRGLSDFQKASLCGWDDASSVLTRLVSASVNTRKRLRAVETAQEALACCLDSTMSKSTVVASWARLGRAPWRTACRRLRLDWQLCSPSPTCS